MKLMFVHKTAVGCADYIVKNKAFLWQMEAIRALARSFEMA